MVAVVVVDVPAAPNGRAVVALPVSSTGAGAEAMPSAPRDGVVRDAVVEVRAVARAAVDLDLPAAAMGGVVVGLRTATNGGGDGVDAPATSRRDAVVDMPAVAKRVVVVGRTATEGGGVDMSATS